MAIRQAGALATVLSAAVMLAAEPVGAQIVKIDIAATVETVDDPQSVLGGAISPGQTITGCYAYDLSTPDTNPLSTVGDYWHDQPPAGMRLEAGPFVFQSNVDDVLFLVELADDHPIPAPYDNYLVRSYNNRSSEPYIFVDYISWQLDDPTAMALSSPNLTSDPPNLPDWQSFFGLEILGAGIPQEGFPNFSVRSLVTTAELGSGDCLLPLGSNEIFSNGFEPGWSVVVH